MAARGLQLLGARHRQHGGAGCATAPPEQKERWLTPLLAGEIRSCFAMTEPDVASSDATNIRSSIARDGDEYVINGRKWWTSGAGDPRCKIAIFMGKTDPDGPDAQAAVDDPRADGRAGRHGQAHAERLRLRPRAARPRRGPLRGRPRARVEHLLLGEGRGFEIAQGRLGPGRIHHCMRLIGLAERVAGGDVPRASRRASPSASRSPSRGRSGPTSPTRASRSSRRGC